MKLLFILHDRANNTGGPSIHATRLYPKLRKMGHEVTALCIWSGGEEAHPNGDKLLEQGISCRFHPFTKYSEPLVKWILGQVKEINPDVFVPDVSTQGCFAGRWVKQAGIPVITTHRSSDALNRGRAAFFSKVPSTWRTSGLVAVNQFLLDDLFQDTAQVIPTCVIPSGVIVPEESCNQDPNPVKIVYAGRLVEKQKRVGDMLKAFFAVCETNPNIQFTVIGDGMPGARPFYEEMVKEAGYSDRICFTGSLYGAAYKQELLKHQIMVLLSDYEGTPGALMDGMSCGLIPVALDIPGIQDLIIQGQTGFLVQDRERSFVSLIQNLAQNNVLRISIGNAARRTIEERYSIEHTARMWEDFSIELLRASTPKRRIQCPHFFNLPAETPLLLEHQKQAGYLERLKQKTKSILQQKIFRKPSHLQT